MFKFLSQELSLGLSLALTFLGILLVVFWIAGPSIFSSPSQRGGGAKAK